MNPLVLLALGVVVLAVAGALVIAVRPYIVHPGGAHAVPRRRRRGPARPLPQATPAEVSAWIAQTYCPSCDQPHGTAGCRHTDPTPLAPAGPYADSALPLDRQPDMEANR